MNEDLIKRSDAIKAFTLNSKGERIPFVDCDNFPVEFPLRYIVDTLTALPPADRPTRVYEYLRERIGDIVDSEAEFEAWFERMVWHVEECNRLADRPQGEWKFSSTFTDSWGNELAKVKCSHCGYETLAISRIVKDGNFCLNCGARMKGADDAQQ